MTSQNTIARTLHDVGLASWFGGALMGAVGLNGASGQVTEPSDRARVANAGWARWTPVNAAAIAAHLLGGAQVTRGNKGRLLVQRQARWVNTTKAGLTLGALAATAYARMLGQRLMDAEERAASQPVGELPVADATSPQPSTPEDAANAQRQLTVMQWVVPAATGALVALNAKAGEQQRPAAVLQSIVRERVPASVRLPADALPDVPWSSVAGLVLGLGALQRLRARRRRRRGAVARDIMTADPVYVSEHDTLEQAARVMVDRNIGAVPVCGIDQELKGMLTDRDIVTRVVADGGDPATVRAGELAGGKPVTIGADDPAREAVRTMAR
ncbi:MAG TPA: CBS domain-containing protein, partial [Euzebyales bacterium]|nr:CBS domain-containing protein [Euzebyales bacterium]